MALAAQDGSTVNRHSFHDESVFEQERERIFPSQLSGCPMTKQGSANYRNSGCKVAFYLHRLQSQIKSYRSSINTPPLFRSSPKIRLAV